MVVRISEYDLLWKWIQDALVLVVIEDGDVDIDVLFKTLLREWQRTPLVKRWGSSEGSPQTQVSSGWLLQEERIVSLMDATI